MSMSGQKGFEGWYFKHQKGNDMVAFIPGQAESGAFILTLPFYPSPPIGSQRV